MEGLVSNKDCVFHSATGAISLAERLRGAVHEMLVSEIRDSAAAIEHAETCMHEFRRYMTEWKEELQKTEMTVTEKLKRGDSFGSLFPKAGE